MALTLVATAGASNANAYATVAQGLAAAAYRVGGNAAAWLALTTDQQIQTLVSATSAEDALEGVIGFKGERATSTQALEWPRTGTAYADTVIPPPLVSATIELAFSYTPAITDATVDVLNPATNGNVKEDTVGPITTIYFEPSAIDVLDPTAALAPFPTLVQRLLAGLIRIAPVSWGSAAVVRSS
jgi:hypothetical protein